MKQSEVLAFAFLSVIHFELILVYGLRYGSGFIFFPKTIQFSPSTFIKNPFLLASVP